MAKQKRSKFHKIRQKSKEKKLKRDKRKKEKQKRDLKRKREHELYMEQLLQVTENDIVSIAKDPFSDTVGTLQDSFDADAFKTSAKANNTRSSENKDLVLKENQSFDTSAWKIDD